MMLTNKWIECIGLFILMCLTSLASFAQPESDAFVQTESDSLGQTIQIDTYLHSFTGKPIWTFIVRDLDHDQTIPYIFDIKKGYNHWVVFTYGRNYLITASNMQIETYRSRYNQYKNYRVKNFCHLESNGRIRRGESMYVSIQGDLSPYTNTYTCQISAYPDGNFGMYKVSTD